MTSRLNDRPHFGAIAYLALFVALLSARFLTGCQAGESGAIEATIANYIGAVQEKNIPRLWTLKTWQDAEKSSLTPPAEFEAEAQNYYSDYELGKRAGEIRFDSWGVAVIKILALGKGVYYRITDVSSPREDARIAVIKVTLPYEYIDYSIFPAETTLYFMDRPLGKIYKHSLGSAAEIHRELLSEISVSVALVKDTQGFSPRGWFVLSVTPVAESAVYRKMNFSPSPPQ